MTELGHTMMPLLQRTYDAANAAQLGASQFHKQDVAWVRIGLGPWVPPDSIMPLLQELDRTFPTLDVSVQHGSTGTLNEWLIGSEIDVAFTVNADGLTNRANAWPLFEDGVAALMHVGHVLAQPAPLRVDQLSDQVGRLGLEEAPQASSGMLARSRHAGTTEEHVWSLLRSGLGITLLTARRRLTPADIICRPLHPPRSVAIHMATIPGRRPARAVDAFVRLARARNRQTAAP